MVGQRSQRGQKLTNKWVARVIPIVLIGIVGYVTWVFIVLLCIHYLLLPPPTAVHGSRRGTAIALLVIYLLLLSLMSISYFRILHTIVFNPGVVPYGPRWHQQRLDTQSKAVKSAATSRGSSNGSNEKREGLNWDQDVENGAGAQAYPITEVSFGPDARGPAPGLEAFYTRNVFVCEQDGLPRWCSKCLNWKPDRAHHCSEIDRCVLRMDHFCPWVGGIVSETNYKFFVQFVAYAALLCIFALIVMANFMVERKRDTGSPNVHWAVTTGLAGLFFLFSSGMTGSSVQLMLLNTTTVENINRHHKVWDLAIYTPTSNPNNEATNGIMHATYQPRITYPLKQEPPPALLHSSLQQPDGQSSAASLPQPLPALNGTLSSPRDFLICHTLQGENPWDLGKRKNFTQVMGNGPLDWILPLRYSPICDHRSGESFYQLGHVVDRLRREIGIRSA